MSKQTQPVRDSKEHILPIDVHEQYMKNMAIYSIAISYERFVPSVLDGLKPVQRRLLYCMHHDIGCTSIGSKRKSANIVGRVMGEYHPHCLDHDTKIYIRYSDITTSIGKLYYKGITTVETIGYDTINQQVIPVTMRDIRIGQYTKKVYNIVFSNGTKIKCTDNHPFLLSDGETYVQAKDLTIQHKLYYHKNDENLEIDAIYIEELDEPVPMYDFTVDSTNNILIPLALPNDIKTKVPMVCVHNSDSAIYDACQPLANWFQCKCPLINYDSNSGSIQGNPHAASRYTEIYLSKFAMDTILADLEEAQSVVDWSTTFDNRTKEPLYLPVKVPLLLVNGTFSIAIGERVEVPPHSLNDVIDATLTLMKNPNAKITLIPDPNQVCELVDTDWKKISASGFGNFIERGIITIDKNSKGDPYLTIRSTPDLVTANDVMKTIEELVKKNILIQILDTEDHSSDKTGLDIRIMLKKGSDPEYVRQVLYKHTALQSTKHVNMRVITENYEIHNIGYKAYLLYFIEFRREVKFRLYNARLQKVETRLHTIDIYIQILESGDVENIIHAIRNQNPQEESQLIQWLMSKLKITDLQAKFILNTEIKKLSKSSLKGYKEEQKRLQGVVQEYINMITHPELIDKEIENELIDIRNKYGQPRRSVIVNSSQANNIPQGTFKIVIYDDASVKKLQLNDPVKTYRGVSPKCVTVGDNDKDILLFDDMGRVFRLPIHKIPFNDKNLSGIDIKTILKKLTSNIIQVLYLPILDELNSKTKKFYIVSVSKKGLIKYIDIADLLSATPSGIIYSKIANGDSICTVDIASKEDDVILYTHSKALRISMADVPYLKRSTLGNIGIKISTDPVMGMSIITKGTKDVVFVTNKGYFNKLSQEALPRGKRAQAGNIAIKLSKNDAILNVYPCNNESIIRCYHMDGTYTDVETKSIQEGSSISSGCKLTKEILKSELIKF